MEKMNDRISYSIGQKISDNKYGNFDVHISYSSDLEKGESPTDGLKRISAFVEGSVKKRIEHHKNSVLKERAEKKARLLADVEED